MARARYKEAAGSGAIMPYVVLPKVIPLADFNPKFAAGIWAPPPADGSNPGGPDDVAVVTSGATGTTLTFPTLAGPPPPPSAMTMTNLTGDLFWSGSVSGPLPTSPAPLTIFILPVLIPHKSHAIIQSDLDAAIATLGLPRSLDVPLWVQAACGIPTLGFYTPQKLTILTATLTLPAPPQVRQL
jgi:hypothetical protein